MEVIWPDTMQLKHFPEYANSEFYVVNQNEWVEIDIKACEDYSYDGHPNQVTYLSNCALSITDEVSPDKTIEDNFNGETTYTYRFAPYLPNINGGYERQ